MNRSRVLGFIIFMILLCEVFDPSTSFVRVFYPSDKGSCLSTSSMHQAPTAATDKSSSQETNDEDQTNYLNDTPVHYALDADIFIFEVTELSHDLGFIYVNTYWDEYLPPILQPPKLA